MLLLESSNAKIFPENKFFHMNFFPLSELLFLVNEMVAAPYETKSDSFYFVNNELVMHNKADYAYDG